MSRVSLVLIWVLASCAETPRTQQLKAAKALAPATLDSSSTRRAGPSRVIAVLAYADDDYRASVLHWREAIAAQLARASEYAEPTLGVTFRVVDAREWNHRLAGPSLQPALESLERLEPGSGVDLVLGYVSSLPTLELSHDELGRARLLGRYAVVRGIESAAEGEAIRKHFTALDVSEREAVYRERKLHKETAILLHEWAHTLGGVHEREPLRLLSPSYSERASGFGPDTVAVLAAMLEAKAARASDVELARANLAELEKRSASWMPGDFARHVEWLRAAPTPQATRPTVVALDRIEQGHADKVVQLVKAGLYVEAERQLAPLLERHPEHPWLTGLSCQIQALAAPDGPKTRAACEAAVAVAPDAWPAATLAKVLLAQKDVEGARKVLASIPPEARAATNEENSAVVASVAMKLSLVSVVEEFAAKAPTHAAAQEATAWAGRVRRSKGLKPSAPPTGVEEATYLDEFRAVQQAMDRAALTDAKKRIAALDAKYAEQPGPLVLKCELQLRLSDMAGALRACDAALARWEEAAYAHYLVGVISEGAGNARRATSAFSRTIALEPTNEDAWRRLASRPRRHGARRPQGPLRRSVQAVALGDVDRREAGPTGTPRDR